MKNGTNGDPRTIGSLTKTLLVKLTTEELTEKSQELAQATQDYSAEQKRQEDVKAQLKARLTEIDSKRFQLAYIVSRREEEREVRCDIVANMNTLVAHITRRDTGEIVSSRPLTDKERQDVLPL